MDRKFDLALFIFRRDLRLHDNNGLNAAMHLSKQVLPCFIFDERQVSDENLYKSDNAIQFMIESLQDLARDIETHQGKLYIFHGNPEKILAELIKNQKIDAVFTNRDYTPFSLKRDEQLNKLCHDFTIPFLQFDDALLNRPGSILTQGGTPFSVFTAFHKRAIQEPVVTPLTLTQANFYKSRELGHVNINNELTSKGQILKTLNDELAVRGGRTAGKLLLKNLRNLKDYQKTRDFPALQTSMLSAHNKFGTFSIREIYHAIQESSGSNHLLLKQLYWRDFFYHVAFHYPHVFGHAFHKKYDNLSWSHNKEHFERWCTGTTGFPIVDAGMRQLNKTGYMHNRVRMIVASFLTKDLHIDWQAGEQYFARNLVDYDPCVNNGNWQWSASTGCDAQPYFRIFNPWLQQAKFDPEAEYIKTWIPELKNIPAATLHNLYKKPQVIRNYPQPMVDHSKETAITKTLYRNA